MCNWCCVLWARQSCLPGNEESFQLYPSNLPFNPEITPKKFCFVRFVPEVWWHSSIFSQPTGCFNESLRHLKAKVRFFLRQRRRRHVCLYATKDSWKWIAEVDPGTLCLVDSFDVRGDKGFKGEHVFSIVERERERKMMVHNENKPNMNSISAPSRRVHLQPLCVLHSWVFDQLKCSHGLQL